MAFNAKTKTVSAYNCSVSLDFVCIRKTVTTTLAPTTATTLTPTTTTATTLTPTTTTATTLTPTTTTATTLTPTTTTATTLATTTTSTPTPNTATTIAPTTPTTQGTTAPHVTASTVGTTTITTEVTTSDNPSKSSPQTTTSILMTTSSVTSGSITTLTTSTTQSTIQQSATQFTTQSSIQTTTINTQVDTIGLPVENLLNIKYEKTTTHNWNFFASNPQITDTGSPDNFLNYHLQSRWSNITGTFFLTNESTHYFTAVNTTSIPSGFNLGAGLFPTDSSSLILPSKGMCLKLYDISKDHPYNRACLSQPESCEYGFSAALWVNFRSDILQARNYLLSSGPNGQQGFQFYYSMGQLYLTIVGRNNNWMANMPMKKYVGSWTIVAFSWRRFNGEIRLLVGDQFVLFNLTRTTHNLNLSPSVSFYLGCMPDTSGFSDPQTTSDMSVGHIGFWLWPVRSKSLLTGSFVYQMVKDVPVTIPSVTTPTPTVTYDFSKVVRELIGMGSDPNPMYTVADEYISVANTAVTGGQVDIVTGGRVAFRLNGKGSKIDISQKRTFASSCPSNLSMCTSGLSLSLWLKLPNSTDSGDILEIVNNLRIAYLNSVVNIIVYNGNISFGYSTTQVLIGVWQNLGLSILLPTRRLVIYINGIADTSATVLNVSYFDRGSTDNDVKNGDFVIGSGQSNSFVGVEMNDIIIWRRNLFPFETHRFVGYTMGQFNQLQNATNYWTTDKYIHDDSRHQIDRKLVSVAPVQMNFSLSSVLIPKTAAVVLDSDPFSKSSGTCPILQQKFTDYLFFARSKLFGSTYQDSDINWTGQCITDPCIDDCRYSGMSVSMWLKIKSVSLTKIQFYLNSGDMADYPGSIDGRGISFFTDQQLFGVSLSTCTSDWNVIIDANRYTINQWMNIGILWREDLGLKLLINGVDYGLINNIPDQIYKPRDLGFRVVSGRFDSDDQSLWQTMGFWEMSNFVFGEIGYFNRYITPDDYSSLIGLVNNAFYSDAVWLRQGMTLINKPILDLLQAKNYSQSYNYEGSVRWNNTVGAVRIVAGRIPVMIDLNSCPTNINKCGTGFSIGGWFLIPRNFSSTVSGGYNLIIQGNMAQSGFGIVIYSNNSFYGWVKSTSLYSSFVPQTSFYGSMNQWMFLGLIFQPNVGLTLIINGKDFFSNSIVPASGAPIDDKRIFVGDSTVTFPPRTSLSVFSTVFYNANLNLLQLQKFLGIQYNQVLLMSKSTYFWSVSGLYYSLNKQQIQMVGITYTKNKYDSVDTAICTSGNDQSYVVLQTTVPNCIQDPNLCTSFVLIININFSPLLSNQMIGSILTAGNNETGVRGLSIIQTSQNTTEFWIRNSTTTCKSVMTNYLLDNWLQVKLLWSSFKNPIVKVDENTNGAAINATCSPENNNKTSTTGITLGRNPSQTGVGAKVCVSEIALMHVLTTVDPDTESSGTFLSSCYQNMDLQYKLNGAEFDQYQMPLSATKLTDAIIPDVLPESCFTNPTKCTNGITISFWVKVDQMTGIEMPLVMVGRPTRRGIGVTVSSSSNATAFGVSANVHTGTLFWAIKQDGILLKSKWTNIGLTWNYITGLNLFINGLLITSYTIPTPALVSDNSLPTSITIGKSVSGYIDNIVVWFKVVAYCQSPQASSKQLTGACKADVSLPVQLKCSVIPNCINSTGSLCLDETQDNIVQMANSGLKITSASDANKILIIVNKVLKKTTTNTNLTMASVSLLMNVATNMIVSDSLTNDAAISLATPFLTVNAELIQDKYQNDWSTMMNLSLYNPLLVMMAADNFYLKISVQLSTPCSIVSLVQGGLGVSLVKIDVRITNCKILNVPNYIDNVWTQNGSAWANCQDSVSLDPQRMMENGPIVSIASSIYNTTTILPSVTSPAANPNSTLTLAINSKVVTIVTNPPFPRAENQTMVTVQLKLVAPNVRTDRAQAWDRVDPINPNLKYQWFPLYWNDSLLSPNSSFGTWDSTGCKAISWNTTIVVFNCDHMTSFTVLMQPVVPSNAFLMKILAYVTMAGLAISLLCLLIFMITIAVSKSLKGTRYIIHLNLALSLFFASIAFILVSPARQNQVFCQAVGVMMHLFFLATFSWLFIEALYVFYAVTSGTLNGKLKCYVPIAWGMPILIVAATAGLSLDSYGRNKFCWLNQNNLFIWAFLGPLMLLIVATISLCLIVACNITTPAVKGDELNEVRDNIKQTAYILPFVLIGWIFGIIYLMTLSIPVAFLFVILCSLEGLWVLIFYGLMNQDFRFAICRRTRPKEPSESCAAILDGIETSRTSLRGKSAVGPMPPPKMSAPVYYSGNPVQRPPRHMDSVEFSRSSLNSERHLIREDVYNDDIDTSTIENNGVPISYSRSIPGTPQYEE